MMRNRRSRWVSGIGAAILTGGVLMASAGLSVVSAAPQTKQDNHTLRWDQVLPASTRFVILTDFNSDAVLDNETGLVWERSPLTTLHPWDLSNGFFASALTQCVRRTTGGRKGWRLPSVHELASLVDPANSNPSLPTGHPFTNVQTNVQSGYYWSATSLADFPTLAWGMSFLDFDFFSANVKSLTLHVWCVRGGMNAGQY